MKILQFHVNDIYVMWDPTINTIYHTNCILPTIISLITYYSNRNM